MLALAKQIYHHLMPNICCICNNHANLPQDLCARCHALFPQLTNACYGCGNKLALEQEHILCQKCTDNPPPFHRLCALYAYESWPKKIIHKLKYNGKLFPAKLLANLFLQQLSSWYNQAPLIATANTLTSNTLNIPPNFPDAILPVPLHPYKLQQRGFNQSYLMAAIIAKRLKIPIIHGLCIKHKHTKAQAELDLSARKTNIKNSFILDPVQVEKFKKLNYKNIVIFDDVVTTMSTVDAICALLHTLGITAENIDIWCICRA